MELGVFLGQFFLRKRFFSFNWTIYTTIQDTYFLISIVIVLAIGSQVLSLGQQNLQKFLDLLCNSVCLMFSKVALFVQIKHWNIKISDKATVLHVYVSHYFNKIANIFWASLLRENE